jgi:hypothetical protein
LSAGAKASVALEAKLALGVVEEFNPDGGFRDAAPAMAGRAGSSRLQQNQKLSYQQAGDPNNGEVAATNLRTL